VRFLAAIAVFIVTAVLLGTGFTQKIFFSGPEFAALSTTIQDRASYVVINGDVLNSKAGLQTVSAEGSQVAFIGYGRTSDVLAWLNGSDYATVTYNPETRALEDDLILNQTETTESGASPTGSPVTTDTTTPAETIVNPAGSDLWIGERVGTSNVSLPMNAGENMSVIIASDGVESAPSEVRLSWPIPSQSPFSTWFIVAGGIGLLVGLLLLMWALTKMKNQNGPKRRGKVARRPRPPSPRQLARLGSGTSTRILPPVKGRRGLQNRSAFLLLPLGLVLTLGIASCSSPYETGQGAVSPSPTATVAPGEDAPLPDVSEPQLARILARVSETVATADKDLDSTLAATRLVGPALQIRTANYTMRTADGSVAALPIIPANPVTFLMPQATDTWPRFVLVVIQDVTDTTVPTTGLVLVQQSPRENYHVEYSLTLEPNAAVPEVAPASVGSAVLAPDSKLLLLEPDQLAAAYGDILMKGDLSPYAGLFDGSADSLRAQIGLPYKDSKRAAIGDKASIEFTQAPGVGLPVSLATNDSGAIVTVSLNENETVRPTEAGAIVNAEGQTKVLAGISTSATGIESTYGIQLSFYVPPVGSTEKIRLLGFSQGLIAARGL
jgi:hypothetical protein